MRTCAWRPPNGLHFRAAAGGSRGSAGAGGSRPHGTSAGGALGGSEPRPGLGVAEEPLRHRQQPGFAQCVELSPSGPRGSVLGGPRDGAASGPEGTPRLGWLR